MSVAMRPNYSLPVISKADQMIGLIDDGFN
jgi:hypothetical protein